MSHHNDNEITPDNAHQRSDYTGNFIDGTIRGKNGHLYRMGDGIALEPQKFPDTPNQPAFGSARIDAQHPYSHTMIYRVTVNP